MKSSAFTSVTNTFTHTNKVPFLTYSTQKVVKIEAIQYSITSANKLGFSFDIAKRERE